MWKSVLYGMKLIYLFYITWVVSWVSLIVFLNIDQSETYLLSSVRSLVWSLFSFRTLFGILFSQKCARTWHAKPISIIPKILSRKIVKHSQLFEGSMCMGTKQFVNWGWSGLNGFKFSMYSHWTSILSQSKNLRNTGGHRKTALLWNLPLEPAKEKMVSYSCL